MSEQNLGRPVAIAANTPASIDDGPVDRASPIALGSAPTVVGAVSHYRALVVALAVLFGVVAVGYTLSRPKIYVARASLAVVQPPATQAFGPATPVNAQQYVAAQVLLLQSPDVASHAADLADATLHRRILSAGDFSGPRSRLTVTPPSSTDPTASIVGVSFGAPSPQIAQVGANALLDAYQQARAWSVKTEADAAMAAIDTSVSNIDAQLAAAQSRSTPVDAQLASSLVTQRSGLVSQRALVFIGEQIALSQTAPTVRALTPTRPANHRVTRTAATGLVIGVLVASAAAYALEVERQRRRSTGRDIDSAAELHTEPRRSARPVRDDVVESRTPTWRAAKPASIPVERGDEASTDEFGPDRIGDRPPALEEVVSAAARRALRPDFSEDGPVPHEEVSEAAERLAEVASAAVARELGLRRDGAFTGRLVKDQFSTQSRPNGDSTDDLMDRLDEIDAQEMPYPAGRARIGVTGGESHAGVADSV